MSHRSGSGAPAKTPIERIFEKVVGRKMTSPERVCLHLGPLKALAHRAPSQRQKRAA